MFKYLRLKNLFRRIVSLHVFRWLRILSTSLTSACQSLSCLGFYQTKPENNFLISTSFVSSCLFHQFIVTCPSSLDSLSFLELELSFFLFPGFIPSLNFDWSFVFSVCVSGCLTFPHSSLHSVLVLAKSCSICPEPALALPFWHISKTTFMLLPVTS